MIALELSRTVRFGLLSAGFLWPVALGLLVRLVGASPKAPEEPEAHAAVIACEPTRMDAVCPNGRRCVAGECKAALLGERAQEGERCGGQACGLGLECYRGSCRPVRELERLVAPDVCRQDDVRETLDELLLRCAQVQRGGGGLLTDCGDEAWREMSKAPDFETRVLSMPGAFSVFFPNGKPDGPQWPGADVRAWYTDRIRASAQPLARARAILVIGRASLSGSAAVNYELARQRARFVRERLQEILGASAPPIREWGLAADFELSIEAMRRRMPAEPIADSAAAEAELAALRASSSEIRRWADTRELLNRVVFVVPLPCDGHEFNPEPAFHGLRQRAERVP